MRVLVVGSGGREHALAWAISASPGVGKVWTAPGNPGTQEVGTNAALDPLDFSSISSFCRNESVDLVVVGPENPLSAGLADFLKERDIPVFGPVKAGARLEASKSAAKEFMVRNGLPHPEFASFERAEEAVEYIRKRQGPWVIKADGLAFGKGVIITADFDEAVLTINQLLSGELHGQAGKRIVIEEFVEGIEATAMALSDGKDIYPLPMAKDHKRARDGDEGPMTGGMGVFSPLPFVTSQMEADIETNILGKTLSGLKKEGIDYRGVIYAGLMLTASGPKILEYNVRFGDPEAQCVLPRLSGNVAGLFMACATRDLAGFLSKSEVGTKPESSVTVVLAANGYPGSYDKGHVITGLDKLGQVSESRVKVFHAGTGKDREGHIVSAGGRVLAVTALGDTLEKARENAYSAVDLIDFPKGYYRNDIACHGSAKE